MQIELLYTSLISSCLGLSFFCSFSLTPNITHPERVDAAGACASCAPSSGALPCAGNFCSRYLSICTARESLSWIFLFFVDRIETIKCPVTISYLFTCFSRLLKGNKEIAIPQGRLDPGSQPFLNYSRNSTNEANHVGILAFDVLKVLTKRREM